MLPRVLTPSFDLGLAGSAFVLSGGRGSSLLVVSLTAARPFSTASSAAAVLHEHRPNNIAFPGLMVDARIVRDERASMPNHCVWPNLPRNMRRRPGPDLSPQGTCD